MNKDCAMMFQVQRTDIFYFSKWRGLLERAGGESRVLLMARMARAVLDML